MEDARNHRACLILALIGTLMLCALMLSNARATFGVIDLPVYKASKPPFLEVPTHSIEGPRA